MSEKKICTLPNVRVNERLHDRTTRAAEVLNMKVTNFIYAAIVEKLQRMESEWSALNSIFSSDTTRCKESIALHGDSSDYAMFDEEPEQK